jgi:hypothetical protein
MKIMLRAAMMALSIANIGSAHAHAQAPAPHAALIATVLSSQVGAR